MCLCTSPYAICRATDRAKGLGRLLKYVLLILFILTILGIVSSLPFTTLMFTIALIITGWCAVRDERAYNIEQLMCVVFISGYLWIYAVVGSISYLVNKSHSVNIISLIALFGDCIFYVASCYISKLLYDELRMNYQQPTEEEMAAGGGGLFGGGRGMLGGGMFGRGMGMGRGMYGQRQQPPQQNPNQYGYGQQQQQPQAQPQHGQGQMHPYQSSDFGQNQKFQAFQGSGHSMA